jgi:hypothetical protein
MNRIFHFVVPAVGFLLICSSTSAQMRARGASARPIPPRPLPPARVTTITRPSSNSAPQVVSGAHVNRQVTVVQVAPNGQQTSITGTFPNAVNFEGVNDVPGLGFDYPHLAAISGNFPFNPPIERGEFGGRGGLNSFTPVFFNETPYLSDLVGPYSGQQGQQQPQIIVIQQPAPAAVAQSTNPVQQPSTTTPSTPPAVTSPVRDVGEFILVRRDGRILFASAFSVSDGQLRYVTPEGIRHTVPVTELDAGATRQMNEALGATVQLHN